MTKARRRCPAHAIWPAIADQVRPGELLHPGYYGTNTDTTLKAAIAKLHVPRAQSYPSHGFRRGEAHELKEKGHPAANRSRRRPVAIPCFPRLR